MSDNKEMHDSVELIIEENTATKNKSANNKIIQQAPAIKVFMSYSHDTPEHKDEVKRIAYILRSKFNIDIQGDFYTEDMPHGTLFTELMHVIKIVDKTIMILTPNYKIKADDGQGGVGYESMLITEELYKDLGSSKFIPVILDQQKINNADYFPTFLSSLRKGIFRSQYNNESSFIEAIARAITNRPRDPKPPLGGSGWKELTQPNIPPESINVEYLAQESNAGILFNYVLKITRNGDITAFKLLRTHLIEISNNKLRKLREDHEAKFEAKSESNLFAIMDKFVNAMAPVLLTAYAASLSSNEKFTKQDGVMLDLLSIDCWFSRIKPTFIMLRDIPYMLAFTYHHIYGAIHIFNENFPNLIRLLNTKLQNPDTAGDYKPLYKTRHVVANIESLGKDCFLCFKFLLNSYERWEWLKLIFKTEKEYRNYLVSYQLTIHILSYIFYLQEGNFNQEINFDVPLTFMIAEREQRVAAMNLIMKESDFFQDLLRKSKISKETAITQWKRWSDANMQISKHYPYYLDSYISSKFIKDLFT
jgi:hypothetical protein